MRAVGMEAVEPMSVMSVIRATPILFRVFRPVFRAIAWALFAVLVSAWAIELVYCICNFTAGGWPAVIGYVQHISQGHNAAPVSWSTVVGIHAAALSITVLLALYLCKWSRGTPRTAEPTGPDKTDGIGIEE